MMSSMPLSACSTFSVAHPLHCGSATSFRQLPTVNTFLLTPVLSPLHLASPTISPTKTRTQPGASPNKKVRKSRVVFDFTTEEMAQYFHMSQREAAQQLGVATVTIKRNCRRLGIVWPYRLMKSKKHAINWSAISREDAQRIRQERALEQAKAGRSPSCRSRSASVSSSTTASEDETVTKARTTLQRDGRQGATVELTEAGRVFARLPRDCMDAYE
uniref:RWP-RK domain-containing protein n=1 Tax=Peronospora matthiolae TaxID=2874970 RepID=A0AAV1V9Z3_9STRA